MNKQMVLRWCRQFFEGRQIVHDEECSGLPQLINDDLFELVRQRVIQEPSLHNYGAEQPFSADITIIASDCH
ncbi:hypothetical protein TNCV_4729431 [Trichonephila clavipes]|nr:hypothetical protein TNCV_4729431 [Trichonephila clavipes]